MQDAAVHCSKKLPLRHAAFNKQSWYKMVAFGYEERLKLKTKKAAGAALFNSSFCDHFIS